MLDTVVVLATAFYIWWILANHDDVIKWKHFPRYWPFVRGIHRSPVTSPHKGQWRGALIFSLICVWIKGWVNNREAGDLRRYRGHYDVSVMEVAELTRYCISCFHQYWLKLWLRKCWAPGILINQWLIIVRCAQGMNLWRFCKEIKREFQNVVRLCL